MAGNGGYRVTHTRFVPIQSSCTAYPSGVAPDLLLEPSIVCSPDTEGFPDAAAFSGTEYPP